MPLINPYGLAFMAVMMIPNIVFAVSRRESNTMRF